MQPDPNQNPVQPTTPSPSPVQAPQIIQPQSAAAPELPVAAAPEAAVAPAPLVAAEPIPPSIPEVSPPVVEQPAAVVIQPQTISPTPEAAPVASQVPTIITDSGTKTKGKRLKIIGAVVAGFMVLAIMAVAGIALLGSKPQIVYTSSDLTVLNTQTYSINRAKQWTDASTNKNLLKYLQSSLGADSSLSDQKIYTYKYNFKTNTGQTLMLVGDTPLGVTDAQLQLGLKSAAAKQQFETGFKSLANTLDTNTLCASVSGKSQSIKYETSKFLVEVRSDADCNYTAANAAKYGSKGIHQSLLLGIKNGTTYLVSFAAVQSDWAKNSSFYQDKIIGSIQPK